MKEMNQNTYDKSSTDLFEVLKRQFNMKDMNPASYSPLVLAYLGDAVYEVIIRTIIVGKGNKQVHKMHYESKQYVKASAQAKLFYAIESDLTEDELKAFKRGRNAKSATVPKNANIVDYRTATGFEALVGYLTMKKSYERIIELIAKGVGE